MNRLLVTLGLGLMMAGTVWAQVPESADRGGATVHRLEVRDGVVYHDGVAMPESAVPEDIELRGFPPMSMDYSGDVTPALEIDGRVFAFVDNRLIEVHNVVDGGERAYAISQPQAAPRRAMSMDDDARRRQAEQEYMNSLSENDRVLYERLVRESNMEDEALRLARAYHQASSDAERVGIQQQLREKLGAMFDLKQENRREEIKQMEESLATLRERMDERRGMRDRIIEHRLGELIGQ